MGRNFFLGSLLLGAFVLSHAAFAQVIEFHIKKGNGTKSWNTRQTEVEVIVGDTLRIINDDTIPHRLHTNGQPCPHGDEMEANGGSYDCDINVAYDSDQFGPLYDHDHQQAKFWIKATE